MPSGFEPVFEDDFFDVSVHATRGIVWAHRKKGEHMRPEHLRVWGERLIEISSQHGGNTGQMGLLIDARDGVGNSDPAFESAVLENRKRLLAHFRVVVNLVRTTVGRLQHERLHAGRPTRERSLVTNDEDEALRWAGHQHRPGPET